MALFGTDKRKRDALDFTDFTRGAPVLIDDLGKILRNIK
jgi:hypothetical protein